jgi:DNA transposition AAA+ family ATPase
MSNPAGATFVETREYRRFVEFCDSCCRYRYIGLCYGVPGVGKTLSARQYADWDAVEQYRSVPLELSSPPPENVSRHLVFYTPTVVSSPQQIEQDIRKLRAKMEYLACEDLLQRCEAVMKDAAEREHRELTEYLYTRDRYSKNFSKPPERSHPTVEEAVKWSAEQREKLVDPTKLIIIDEADRLKMAGLEQIRDIFDHGGLGMVLIGMPGLEKRLARYPQLYSRVGFVHEFRPLSHAEVRNLLECRWSPPEVTLPDHGLADEEGLAAILRITGGNFRLLHRLLTQIGRILEINKFTDVTSSVVEAARESLVIGTA